LPLDTAGSATRDFIFVDDVVNGLVACAVKGSPGEAYNLASGVETTVADLAYAINQLTGNPTVVDFKPARDWDRSGKRFGSTEKSRNQLQFEASVPILDGLRRTVEWTLANHDNIKRIMSNHDLMLRQQMP
jgi:UDP-glucose 4-epimerase